MAFVSRPSFSCTNNCKCPCTREPGHPAPYPQKLNPHTRQPAARFAARRNKIGCGCEAELGLNFSERSTPVTKNWMSALPRCQSSQRDLPRAGAHKCDAVAEL